MAGLNAAGAPGGPRGTTRPGRIWGVIHVPRRRGYAQGGAGRKGWKWCSFGGRVWELWRRSSKMGKWGGTCANLVNSGGVFDAGKNLHWTVLTAFHPRGEIRTWDCGVCSAGERDQGLDPADHGLEVLRREREPTRRVDRWFSRGRRGGTASRSCSAPPSSQARPFRSVSPFPEITPANRRTDGRPRARMDPGDGRHSPRSANRPGTLEKAHGRMFFYRTD